MPSFWRNKMLPSLSNFFQRPNLKLATCLFDIYRRQRLKVLSVLVFSIGSVGLCQNGDIT